MNPANDPQLDNVREIAQMIEELGGTAEVIAWATPAALAEQFIALQQRLATHIIVIGVVPLSSVVPPENDME